MIGVFGAPVVREDARGRRLSHEELRHRRVIPDRPWAEWGGLGPAVSKESQNGSNQTLFSVMIPEVNFARSTGKRGCILTDAYGS
jgi:hypothetical protein